LSHEASGARLTVSDTGPGIAPDLMPHVFERFNQGDSSRRSGYGGLGLGLAIVKHVVELHGGHVEAQSPGEGRGASFRVDLPVMAIAATSLPIPPGSLERMGPRLDGISVLVVDDHEDGRVLVATVLGQLGATVLSASNARDALALLQEKRPDVLLSDIEMPGQSGYDLLAKVRALPSDQGGSTPAVALTAHACSEDRARGVTAGYETYVTKPARFEQLAAAIAAVADPGEHSA
jgi:CheY-like chemotaxis protein